jgi:hypothetical protein
MAIYRYEARSPAVFACMSVNREPAPGGRPSVPLRGIPPQTGALCPHTAAFAHTHALADTGALGLRLRLTTNPTSTHRQREGHRGSKSTGAASQPPQPA